MSEAPRAEPVRARTRTRSAAAEDTEPAFHGGRDARRGPSEPGVAQPAYRSGRDARGESPERIGNRQPDHRRARELARAAPRRRERVVWSIPDEAIAAGRLAAAAAAAVVVNTSTGSAVVVAVALAVALGERRSAIAVGLVVVAGALRYGSSSLDGWAGVQSVLGVGVEIGPVTGAASAWLCVLALVLTAGAVPAEGVGAALDRVVPSLALGGLGAAVAFGAGPDGDLWMRVVGVAVVTVVAFVVSGPRLAGLRHRHNLAVVVGVAAVVGAGWPG